jgi:hypothetical protein
MEYCQNHQLQSKIRKIISDIEHPSVVEYFVPDVVLTDETGSPLNQTLIRIEVISLAHQLIDAIQALPHDNVFAGISPQNPRLHFCNFAYGFIMK